MVSFANTDERWAEQWKYGKFCIKKNCKTSIISNYFPLIQWIKKMFHLYRPFSLIFGKGSDISFFFV